MIRTITKIRLEPLLDPKLDFQEHSKNTKNIIITPRCLIEGWGRLLNLGFFSDPEGAY